MRRRYPMPGLKRLGLGCSSPAPGPMLWRGEGAKGITLFDPTPKFEDSSRSMDRPRERPPCGGRPGCDWLCFAENQPSVDESRFAPL